MVGVFIIRYSDGGSSLCQSASRQSVGLSVCRSVSRLVCRLLLCYSVEFITKNKSIKCFKYRYTHNITRTLQYTLLSDCNGRKAKDGRSDRMDASAGADNRTGRQQHAPVGGCSIRKSEVSSSTGNSVIVRQKQLPHHIFGTLPAQSYLAFPFPMTV